MADLTSSLSARRAWIEMLVALSVLSGVWSLSARRAWIEMGYVRGCFFCAKLSLSARRAWIEILMFPINVMSVSVALRKESVDRNQTNNFKLANCAVSLSARRAWIEILIYFVIYLLTASSLSARRAWIEILCRIRPPLRGLGRSPQGERG